MLATSLLVAVLAASPDRVSLLAAGDPEYQALAIPRSYKSAPDAPTHLLVFRGGLCIRDYGVADTRDTGRQGAANRVFVVETGTNMRALLSQDGNEAVILRTHYVSRVDLTPGETSTAGDTVTGDTTLTMIDPAHPGGRWRVTLENSRWAKDVLVLSRGNGVLVTTFVPRNGPVDLRILDGAGHELLRIPPSSAETLRIDASPDGGYAAAEVAFRDNPLAPERGVIVFDIGSGSQWTYGWRYGTDAEPVSWKLLDRGVLAVKLAGGTRRFDARGRKL